MILRLSVAICFCCMALAAPAIAEEIIPGPVPAIVLSTYDGDTFHVTAHIWPTISVTTGVRVRGIDTPEIRGHCESEKRRARQARDFLRTLLASFGDRVLLYDLGEDAYPDRVDARVLLPDGRDVAAVMIAAGVGRPYDGKIKRKGWCP